MPIGKQDTATKQPSNKQKWTDEVLVVRADRPFRRGDTLCEDYGDQSDYEFAAHHDFVPRLLENPVDCVRLPVPAVGMRSTESEEARLSSSAQAGESVGGQRAQTWLRLWQR